MARREDAAITIRCPGCGCTVFSWTVAGATPEGRVCLHVRHRSRVCALELTGARAGAFRRHARETMARFAARLRCDAAPADGS
ncbi:MAG TPA: hypothetical protein VFP65_02945 [Anaeromyxobacteraceae bacterium]|nr:hypothetical protein [Anaeromyxobacteraceae bacterium]